MALRLSSLEELDAHLQSRSYVSGAQASRDDLECFMAISHAPPASLLNASRWHNHISVLLAQGFPGHAAGVSLGFGS